MQTGKPTTRHKVTEVPVTEGVTRRVEQLAKRGGLEPAEPTFKTYCLLTGVGEQEGDAEPETEGGEPYSGESESEDSDGESAGVL